METFHWPPVAHWSVSDQSGVLSCDQATGQHRHGPHPLTVKQQQRCQAQVAGGHGEYLGLRQVLLVAHKSTNISIICMCETTLFATRECLSCNICFPVI